MPHQPKHAHLPPADHTDSQILAVVYQKVFEIDERLFGDGKTGELPDLREKVSQLAHFKSMLVGGAKVIGAAGTLVGLYIGVLQVIKLIHG